MTTETTQEQIDRAEFLKSETTTPARIMDTIKRVHHTKTMNSFYRNDPDMHSPNYSSKPFEQAEETLTAWLDPNKSNFVEMWSKNEKMSVDEIIRWAITEISDLQNKLYWEQNLHIK